MDETDDRQNWEKITESRIRSEMLSEMLKGLSLYQKMGFSIEQVIYDAMVADPIGTLKLIKGFMPPEKEDGNVVISIAENVPAAFRELPDGNVSVDPVDVYSNEEREDE